MFEKEANEWTEKNISVGISMYNPSIEMYCGKAFKDGAKLGLNKANEWHYVKDELPPEDVPLLCVRGGKIYVAWYWDNIYHDSRCFQVKKPYAWKIIVLPKESE